jgi:hypothetical protein
MARSLVLFYLLIILVILPIGSACDSDVADRPGVVALTQYDMRTIMRLFLKLRDGFSNDTVTIKVNGKEVYHKSGVSTDLTISFADAMEVTVEQSIIKLEVTVEGGPMATKEVRVQETPFVDVWVIEGKMELRESNEEVPMV